MSCISANAKLVRETTNVDASLQRELLEMKADLLRESIEVEALMEREKVSGSASVLRDPLEARAFLTKEKIDIEAAITCMIAEDNSLWASDGVLYDSVSEPLFVTE